MVQEYDNADREQEPAQAEDFDEIEPEEVQPIKSAVTPDMPSPAEVEAHRETHLPYRSWCIDCVLGRSGGQQHRRVVDNESSVPMIVLDYFFMTPSNFHFKKEDVAQDLEAGEDLDAAIESGKVVKCLIMKCVKSKAVAAIVVPQKGLDPNRYASDRMTAFVEWFGHTKIIIK